MIRRSVTGGGLCAELGRSVTERVACVVAAAGCEAGRGSSKKTGCSATLRSLRQRLHGKLDRAQLNHTAQACYRHFQQLAIAAQLQAIVAAQVFVTGITHTNVYLPAGAENQ